VLTSLVAFVFVLGVLIFVHELGHFLVAKRLGVRVLRFQLGFNPTILSFKRGDTEYSIGVIPLGGYVKMAGENPDDERAGRDDEFLSKSKWQRFRVLAAGPTMNILLSIVVLTFVKYRGADVPAYEQQPPIIGQIVDGSAAARGGLRVGDRILSVDGRAVDTWEQLTLTVSTKAHRQVRLGVLRDGAEIAASVTPDAQTKYEVGDLGVMPPMHPQVLSVAPGSPAERAGLQRGDVVLAAAGQPDISRPALIELIKVHDKKPFALTIRRGASMLDVEVTPEPTDGVPKIGAVLSLLEFRSIEPTLAQAAGMSLAQNWEWTRLIAQTVVGLLTRETPLKQLMGPVAIAELSGGAAELGWIALFNLMAMISLNLGLLNLLPIPVLDGGHIAIMGLEGLFRRDFSMRVKEKLLLAGFVFLLMLMATVIYNDLARAQWLQGLKFWR
jgi:regulator of sigma E protease